MTATSPATPGSGSLLADIPGRLDEEHFSTLLAHRCARIERIVSTGQATPSGVWLDQRWDEWVLLISGAAEVLFASETTARRLGPGSYLLIPRHVRHRVTWTDPDYPTVWLAIHLGAAPDPSSTPPAQD